MAVKSGQGSVGVQVPAPRCPVCSHSAQAAGSLGTPWCSLRGPLCGLPSVAIPSWPCFSHGGFKSQEQAHVPVTSVGAEGR